jgi:hypothetical protein
MTRGALVLAAAALVVCVSRTAAADIYDRSQRHQGLSHPLPDFAVDIRFGPYTPRIDSEFSGATPYADTFGDKTRFLFGLEVDWLVLKLPGVGSVGPGFGWGVTGMTAKAPKTDGTGRSQQETNLWIMPMYAVAVGRLSALSDAGVPVEPYAKAGIGVAPWWTNDSVKTSEVDGVVGRGISTGYQFALGLVLNLTFLDPEAGDSETGNAGIFGEFYYSNLNGFGSGNQMQVGATTWAAGINVKF